MDMRDTLLVNATHTRWTRPDYRAAGAWGWGNGHPAKDHARRIIVADFATGEWLDEFVSRCNPGGYIRSFVKNNRRCFHQQDMARVGRSVTDDELRAMIGTGRLPFRWVA